MRMLRLVDVIFGLADAESERRQNGADGGQSDVNNYAPLVFCFDTHNLIPVCGLRFMVYSKP